jgi:hypothetical protein
MSMELRQLQQPARDENRLGLLGRQIRLAIATFRERERMHRCDVREGEFAASDLLPNHSKRKHLAYESLPPSVQVKAIGIDAECLFIELGPFDKDRAEEQSLPDGVRLDIPAHAMWHGRRKLAHIAYAPPDVREEHRSRWLWMVSWARLPQESLDLAIRTLDQLHEADVYYMSRPAPKPIAAPAPRSPMEKRLGMQMELIQEQVPVLSLDTNLGLRQGLSHEFRQLQRFETWLNRNPAEAIQEALESDDSVEGQERLVNFILFKMARDVREAAAQVGKPIEWSEARRIVRKMMQR